jgi:hypothetical protein
VLRRWLLRLLATLLLLLLLSVRLRLAACRGLLLGGRVVAGAQATAASAPPAQPSSRCALQARKNRAAVRLQLSTGSSLSPCMPG